MFRSRGMRLVWQITGILLAVAGIALIVRFIPPAVWIFLGGLLLIIMGWRLFQWGQGYY